MAAFSYPPRPRRPLPPRLESDFDYKPVSLTPESDLCYRPQMSPESLRNPSFFTELLMSTKLSIDSPQPQKQQRQQHYHTYSARQSAPTSPTSPKFPSPLSSRSHRRTSTSLSRSHIRYQIPEEPSPSSRPSRVMERSFGGDQVGLEVALKSKVVNSIGQEIEFGQVLHPKFRTVVIFVRHFRCPFCQQYIKHLSELTTRDPNMTILRSRVKIIIIGQGHFEMIGPYRALYNCPFPIYSDQNPHHPLYAALGMTSRSFSRGPDLLKGSYLDHVSILQMLIHTIKNAAKMPLKYGGDLRLNGGEFVFEPIPQHRIKRKPIQMVNQQDPHHQDQIQSSHPTSPILMTIQQPPTPKVSKPTRAFLQSQILINFANHVNNKNLDSNTSSTSSNMTARSNFSTISAASTVKNSVCTATSASYSIWSEENRSQEGRQQAKLKFQCRFIHRMRFMRDHASLADVLIAAGLKLIN